MLLDQMRNSFSKVVFTLIGLITFVAYLELTFDFLYIPRLHSGGLYVMLFKQIKSLLCDFFSASGFVSRLNGGVKKRVGKLCSQQQGLQ